jgi:protein kinase C substrate 80K-H
MAVYDIEAYLPEAVRSWADSKLRDLRLFLIENGIIAGTDIHGDAVDPAISTAREQTNSAKSQLETFKDDLKRAREDLDMDYGPDSIFRALKGKCVAKDSGEYTYELCWFDQTKQKSKKSGSSTNMGNYVSYEMITVDDELPADGRGLGTGERIAMKHENGQHCWNGPNRSTLVVLGCSEVDEIWKISEEEKCVYRMEVGTPAVCQGRTAKNDAVKDEL